MEQLLKEFGLYDVVGHIIPGTAFLWLLGVFFGWKIPKYVETDSKVPGAALFLVVAFVLGNIFQTIGSSAERHLYRPHNRRDVAVRYSGDDGFRKSLEASIQTTFGSTQADKHIDLCQTYCQVRGIDSYISIMRGRYGFFRGLGVGLAVVAGLLVASVLSGLAARAWPTTRRFLAWWLFGTRSPRGRDGPGGPRRGRPMLRLAQLAFVSLVILFCYKRYVDFDRYFTDHVYRTYLVDRIVGVKKG